VDRIPDALGYIRKPFVVGVDILLHRAGHYMKLVRSKEAAISIMFCACEIQSGAENVGNILVWFSKSGSPF